MDNGKPRAIATVVCFIHSIRPQREDEIKKHASRLVVETYHGSRTKNKETICLYDLRVVLSPNEVDVIISTSTCFWPSTSKLCPALGVGIQFAISHQYKVLRVSSRGPIRVRTVPLQKGSVLMRSVRRFYMGRDGNSCVELFCESHSTIVVHTRINAFQWHVFIE